MDSNNRYHGNHPSGSDHINLISDTVKDSMKDYSEECMACCNGRSTYRIPLVDADIDGMVHCVDNEAPDKVLDMKLRGDWYVCAECVEMIVNHSAKNVTLYLIEKSRGSARTWLDQWELPEQAAAALYGILTVIMSSTSGPPQCINDLNN
jgi:hypothetical protein